MNFELSPEQALLKDSVERLLAARFGFEARRRIARAPLGWSRETWAALAELGLLGAPFAEVDGGLGGGPVETLVVAEAFGAVLAAEPYLATVVLGGSAVRLSSNAAVRAALVPAVAVGATLLAYVDAPSLTARRDGGGWVVDGRAVHVLHGDCADRLVVASTGGGAVLLADAAAAGIVRRPFATFDGLRAAEIRFSGVRVGADGVLAVGEEAEGLIERVRQHAIAWLAAEAVGVMAMLLQATVEHLGARTQFGQPLGKFQALQHRCAEMLVVLEQARSMAIYAAMMVEDPDASERRKAFSAVKAVIGGSGRFVGQNAVQLHGGTGVTDEHRVGWGLRRLTLIDLMFGDADGAIAELAELGGFVAPAAASGARDGVG